MKGTKVLEYKHWFVIDGDNIYWEKPDLLRAKISMLNNKRGYAIITVAEEKPTVNQYAFYFGGIIRGECMNSNCFAGLNEKEIHQILFKELKTYKRGRTIITKQGDDIEILEDFIEDFDSYGKKQMTKYIEEVIPHLLNNYNIRVKDSKEYSLKNSHIISKEK
jgi:hypothetical protein